MTAIDTNVLVRFLTNDDPEQAEKAKRLIGSTAVTVGPTVLLETAWVLKGAYKCNKDQIVKALRAFAGLPMVSIERSFEMVRALDWCEAGMEIADAIHLSLAMDDGGFATFDQRPLGSATELGISVVFEPE